MRRLPFSMPWILAAVVVGLLIVDHVRPRQRTTVDEAAATAEVGRVAIDPICSMQIATASSDRVDIAGRAYFFCTAACRDEFAADPERFAEAVPVAPESHTMRGLPRWAVQASVGFLLVLSFGLFELFPKRLVTAGPPVDPMAARFDLLSLPGLRRAFRKPYLVFALRFLMAAMFLIVIAAGLFGNQNPAMNIAPLLTWTIWWAGLVFLILYLGKAWCTVCPWDAIATWIERLKLWGPRRPGEGLGLDLKWPRALRNIWLAVFLFVLLTWVELGMGITLIPRATAYLALGMLGMAIVSVFLFDRKAFCRYACLVGRVSGLYSLFSGLELRVADPAACADCKTMDCYRGNDRGDGCPTHQFPKTMELSSYCTLCTECVKTCPSDNLAINLRPWGTDLVKAGRPRTDEAFLALVLLSMTAFHGLTMTPTWSAWTTGAQDSWAMPGWAVFAILMAALLVLPIAIYWVLVQVAVRLAGGVSARRLFVEYAYALLPIALFYHLAHNAEHFLMEGPKIVPLLSDPFGWGWNLFGTASWSMAPLVSLEGLWGIQIVFVVVGHVYSLWIAEKTTRRLVPERRLAIRSQLPMLAAMVLSSALSLWLLGQPMEMRVSAM